MRSTLVPTVAVRRKARVGDKAIGYAGKLWLVCVIVVRLANISPDGTRTAVRDHDAGRTGRPPSFRYVPPMFLEAAHACAYSL